MSERSQRQLKVGEQIKRIIAEAITRAHFKNSVLQNASIITVTEVRVSPDLRQATAYVMPLGGQKADELIPALNDEAWAFNSYIAKNLSSKNTPRIKFILDDSFDEASKIETLLKNI